MSRQNETAALASIFRPLPLAARAAPHTIALTLISVCSLVAGSGCGLVWIPYVQSLPEPVRRVRVLDAETEQPIAGACVTFDVHAVANSDCSLPESEQRLAAASYGTGIAPV